MSDIHYWVQERMHEITLRQYIKLAKTAKDEYEKKAQPN